MAAPVVELAPARAVDPVLSLAEVICRLRASGVSIPMDRESLADAYAHWLALLGVLGLYAPGGELAEVDVLLLRCAVAPRRGDGARSA